MAEIRISGVWKDGNGVITHYAFHTHVKDTIWSRAVKTSKVDAIKQIEETGNKAVTWVWNYTTSAFNVQEEVTVVNGSNGKYLRSNPDRKVTDNLAHLINYDWIIAR